MVRTVASAVLILFVAALSTIAAPRRSAAAGDTPATEPAAATARSTAKPQGPAPHAGRLPAHPPRTSPPRHPHSYATCNRLAQARKLRGAERRHFVARCQLGFGHPLFRRRGRAAHG